MCKYCSLEKLYVYSKDELHGLGWFKLSSQIWKEPDNLESSITDFDALQWYLTTTKPMRLQKDLEDAFNDIKIKVERIVECDATSESITTFVRKGDYPPKCVLSKF